MAVVGSLSWMKLMHLPSYFGGGGWGVEMSRREFPRSAEWNQACTAVSLQSCSKGSPFSREAETSRGKQEEEQDSTNCLQNILEFPPVSEKISYIGHHKAHTVSHASRFCQVLSSFATWTKIVHMLQDIVLQCMICNRS